MLNNIVLSGNHSILRNSEGIKVLSMWYRHKLFGMLNLAN